MGGGERGGSQSTRAGDSIFLACLQAVSGNRWGWAVGGASFSSSNPAARSDGVLEYCAASELHLPSGLGMLKGWQIVLANLLGI